MPKIRQYMVEINKPKSVEPIQIGIGSYPYHTLRIVCKRIHFLRRKAILTAKIGEETQAVAQGLGPCMHAEREEKDGSEISEFTIQHSALGSQIINSANSLNLGTTEIYFYAIDCYRL
jgi:hypothetical protein